MFINLIAFSQKGTTTETKCFPIPLVRVIAKDLLSGDSAKALLKVTEQQLDSAIRKTLLQDTVIAVHREKEKNFNNIIGYEREKFDTLKTYTNKIETDLKTERTKTKWLRWANYGTIAVLGVVAFILK